MHGTTNIKNYEFCELHRGLKSDIQIHFKKESQKKTMTILVPRSLFRLRCKHDLGSTLYTSDFHADTIEIQTLKKRTFKYTV